MPTQWTQEVYASKLKEVHGSKFKLLGRYINSATGVELKCVNCKHRWSPAPRDVIHAKSGCPNCYRIDFVPPHTKTHDEYVEELRKVNPNIECLGTYVTYSVKILHKCLRCFHKWTITPNNTLFKHGCPACKVERNSFRRKHFQLGDKAVQVQGYEPQALQYMLERGMNPKHLLVSTLEGKPSIRYHHRGKDKLFVPDFYHTKRNRIIEVKSTFTLGLHDHLLRSNWKQMQAKAKATLASGYDFVLIVMSSEGERIKFPKQWYQMKRSEVINYVGL